MVRIHRWAKSALMHTKHIFPCLLYMYLQWTYEHIDIFLQTRFISELKIFIWNFLPICNLLILFGISLFSNSDYILHNNDKNKWHFILVIVICTFTIYSALFLILNKFSRLRKPFKTFSPGHNQRFSGELIVYSPKPLLNYLFFPRVWWRRFWSTRKKKLLLRP